MELGAELGPLLITNYIIPAIVKIEDIAYSCINQFKEFTLINLVNRTEANEKEAGEIIHSYRHAVELQLRLSPYGIPRPIRHEIRKMVEHNDPKTFKQEGDLHWAIQVLKKKANRVDLNGYSL